MSRESKQNEKLDDSLTHKRNEETNNDHPFLWKKMMKKKIDTTQLKDENTMMSNKRNAATKETKE